MKKTILTIMVAAMMLVAFTACEQAPIDVNGYVPSDLSIRYNGNGVLKGQELNPADFSGTITYKNGQTAPYTGTYSVQDASGMTTYTDGNNTVVAAVVSADGQSISGVSATCNVVGYIPTEVKIDVSNAVSEFVEADDVSKEGLVVTAIYNGGKEMTLDGSYITATAGEGDVGDTVKITLALGSTWEDAWGENVKVTPSAEWKAEIVAAEPTAADVVSIKSVALKDGVNVYYGGTAVQKDGTSADLDESDFVVIGVTADDEEVELADTDFAITYASDLDIAKSGNLAFEVSPINSNTFEPAVFDKVLNVQKDLAAGYAIDGAKITVAADKSYTIKDTDLTSKIAANDAETSEAATGTFKIVSVSSRLIEAGASHKDIDTVKFTWSGNNHSRIYTVSNVAITVENPE